MDRPQDPEAAETVQTTSVPAVDLPRLVRLSDPQKRLLANLAAGHSCSPEYKPSAKLIGYGLAEIRKGKWSGDRVMISSAGRSYFEANAQAMTAPHQTLVPDNALPALVIGGLLAVGFKFEPSTGRFWHWTESPGIELIDGKWFPCDMFYNGDMQYSDDGYESPVDAAKQAVRFFS